jgi:hypothetical protein
LLDDLAVSQTERLGRLDGDRSAGGRYAGELATVRAPQEYAGDHDVASGGELQRFELDVRESCVPDSARDAGMIECQPGWEKRTHRRSNAVQVDLPTIPSATRFSLS